MTQRPRRNLYCPECHATKPFERQDDGTWRCLRCGKRLLERA